MNNNFNGKHLSLEDRKKIEEGIEKGLRKFEIANENYLYTLKDFREGVNLTYPELNNIAHIIVPLIEQGQSIYQILENHPEINLCAKTLYTYIAYKAYDRYLT